MLEYLRRNVFNAPSALKLPLFKTLARSQLEHSVIISDTTRDILPTALEFAQNNSIFFIISNYNPGASITPMRNTPGLPTLCCRQKEFFL